MFVLNNVSVKRENKKIVDSISFSCFPGSTHLLLGKNGAGKSSLAFGLMGHPFYSVSGNAFLYGVDILTLPPHERSKQGLFLSFQHPQEIPNVTAETFLYEMCRSHGYLFETKADFFAHLKPILQLVDLPEHLLTRELNHGFSGGEKKRFELVQLLMLKPKVALLDEPDSGVDKDAVQALCHVITYIKQQIPDIIMIIITHYQQLFSHLKLDAVHVMHQGKLLLSGTETVATNIFQHGYQRYISNQNG